MATTLDRGLERDQPVELKVVGARRRGRMDRVLLYAVLIAIAIFFILPLVVVVSAPPKYRSAGFTHPGLIPSSPSLENYVALFSGSAEFATWFKNSAIVS